MNAIQAAVSSIITKSKESPVQTLLVTTVLALAGIGAASYTGFFSNGSEKLAPAVTEEEAKAIMEKMRTKLRLLVSGFQNYAQQIKQQIAAQGQEIDDNTLLRSIILPQLEGAFKEVQEAVLEEFGVDDDELEEAVTEYLKNGDEELHKIAKDIRQIFRKFGADIEDDWEDEDQVVTTTAGGSDVVSTSTKKKTKDSKKGEMSLEEFIKFLAVFAQTQVESTRAALADFVAEWGTKIDEQTMPLFQEKLMVASQQAQNQIEEVYGVDETTIERLVTKYQSNPTVQQVLQSMQIATMQAMQQSGIQGLGM